MGEKCSLVLGARGVPAHFKSRCTWWSSKRLIPAFCHFIQTLKACVSILSLFTCKQFNFRWIVNDSEGQGLTEPWILPFLCSTEPDALFISTVEILRLQHSDLVHCLSQGSHFDCCLDVSDNLRFLFEADRVLRFLLRKHTFHQDPKDRERVFFTSSFFQIQWVNRNGFLLWLLVPKY